MKHFYVSLLTCAQKSQYATQPVFEDFSVRPRPFSLLVKMSEPHKTKNLYRDFFFARSKKMVKMAFFWGSFRAQKCPLRQFWAILWFCFLLSRKIGSRWVICKQMTRTKLVLGRWGPRHTYRIFLIRKFCRISGSRKCGTYAGLGQNWRSIEPPVLAKMGSVRP